MSRPRLIARHGLNQAAIDGFIAVLAIDGHLNIPLWPIPIEVRESTDERVLAAALGERADHPVTGDNDLLTLAGDPLLGRRQIATTPAFFDLLSRST